MTAETAIRKVIADFTEAYNANDWNRMQTIFDDDLVDMSAGSFTRTGAAAREYFRSRVAATHANFRPTLSVTIDEIQEFGAWAFDRGSLEVTLEPRQDGATTYIRQRFLEIWKRRPNGEWRICRIMDNDDHPPVDPTADGR